MSLEPVRLGELVDGLSQQAGAELGKSLDLTISPLSSAENVRQILIRRLGTLEDRSPGVLSFIANPRYHAKAATTTATAVFCTADTSQILPATCVAIETPEPYVAYAIASQWFAERASAHVDAAGRASSALIHPTAFVAAGATLGQGVRIGAQAVVESGARLGHGVEVGPGCIVEHHAQVGDETVLRARVVLGARCHIGARGLIHSGVVIGADGFGFAPFEARWVKIAQLGRVVIGNDVEIGANTCIDRGALGDTVLGHGVKLDNLIQIGHNVQIGDHTAMAGCVGVAGSAVIGARCTLGGGAVVLGHLSLVDDVHVSAASVVTRSILKAGHYSGFFPLDDNSKWERNAASLRQLDAMRQRLKALESSQRFPKPTGD